MKSIVEVDASLSNQQELILRRKIDEIWFDKDKSSTFQKNIGSVCFIDYNFFINNSNSLASTYSNHLIIFIYENKKELTPEILRKSDFFVCKSFSENELSQELLRIKKILVSKAPQVSVNKENEESFIHFSGPGMIASLKIDIDSILYLEAYGSLTTVHYLANGQVISKKINYSITNCEASVPDNLFYRVHRQFIVNGKKVKKVNSKSGLELSLNQDIVVPVARRRKNGFLEWYENVKFI